MSESAENEPYAGPGRETERREDMPDEYTEVKQFVEEVDEKVPEEHLQDRVAETFSDQPDRSDR